MAVLPELLTLIHRFEEHLEEHLSVSFNEESAKTQFIEPLFELLGWDVRNRDGLPEAWREVLHQHSIPSGPSREAPDYIFKFGKTKVFVVEAKKPATPLDSDLEAALQARSYGWNLKVPVILTNFRELSIYDYRQPKPNDKVSTALRGRYLYREYAEKWEEISNIFSKDAVRRGQLEKFIESKKVKKGAPEVDEAFLKEIEQWRKMLASNLALRNPGLSERELQFAVQATIDRIIFLRIGEDRGAEGPGRLHGLINAPRIYSRLFKLFEEADDRYNSGLFHFREEREQTSEPDRITPHLQIDDDKLRLIIKSLYENFYNFSLIPVEILGHIYEKFLGNVIELTEGHQARVKLKPEVKKAGGVFYTPSYVVEFIVAETLGKLLDGKSPAQVSKLKILDPACGSGSFLLGAFEKLLEWHLDYYSRQPKQCQKQIYPIMGGGYRLMTTEKKRILLNSIFGVDIDPQAVEVTKLSLLLKVLENETEESLRQLKLVYKERALPDLSDNIKCGNSLVGTDFDHNHQLNFLDEDERLRINAFDWETGFPELFRGKESGFDAIIGNPPYGSHFTARENLYFPKHYSLFKAVKDIYVLFIECSLSQLLKIGGKLSFIVPSAWLGGPGYETLREFLLNYKIENLILMPFDVFKEAYVDTAIMVVAKDRAAPGHRVQTYIYGKREKISAIKLHPDKYMKVKQGLWKTAPDKKIVLDPKTLAVMDQIRKRTSLTLDDVLRIKRGVLFDQELLTHKRSSHISYRYFEGDVYRYQMNFLSKHWIELNDQVKEKPREFRWFEGERILLRRLVSRQQRLMATLVSDTFVTNKNLYSILVTEEAIDLHCVLGILNSKLISYLYLNQVAQATKDDFPQITIKDVLGLPFLGISTLKSHQQQLVKLVQQMLALHQKLPAKRLDYERTALKRQLEATDREIDRLVYDLYGLTEEEIKIVEGQP